MADESRRIRVNALARVEGEGAMHVEVHDGRVENVRLEIFEPPRFFEALLRGRDLGEAPDITARICGICPVAYQMSAVHAMEDALGIVVGGTLRELRRLLYCGEWIESHALHVYMLHAPDFLGYEDAIRMARDHPKIVERGLKLKKAGNALVTLVGGREIHPVNVRVGGFYRVPEKSELGAAAENIRWARDAALETVRWVGTFAFPDFETDYEFVSLRHPSEYPFNEGRVVSSGGMDVDAHEYRKHFSEKHARHSNALQSEMKGGGRYLVGPMARYNLNFDRLPPSAQQAARDAGLGEICRNPFRSIIVRAVETVFACEEALRIIDRYEKPATPAVKGAPREAEGCAISEAPRGMLYHRYRIDAEGRIREAVIVPPTAQNLSCIEADLRGVAERFIDLGDAALTMRCEQAIRNYDPCISCATHFLRLQIERR